MKRAILFLALIFSMISSVSQAVTVPPWWMIEGSWATGSSSASIGKLLTQQQQTKSYLGSLYSMASDTIATAPIDTDATTSTNFTRSNGSLITQVSGVYLILGQISYKNNDLNLGEREVFLYKNSGAIGYTNVTTKGYSALQVMWAGPLSAGDVITLRGYYTATTAVQVQNGIDETFLTITKLY